MKMYLSIVLMFSLLLSSSWAANQNWLTNFDDALKMAKKEKKPILADFTGSDWCGWCIKLHKEVFSKQEFTKYAAKNLVLLELDYPMNKPQNKALKAQNKKLAERYKIQGYPTVLLLDANGDVLSQTGYQKGGAVKYVKHLESLLSKSSSSASLWLTDFEKAKSIAQAEGKVILADFSGSDWCHWCIILKKEVFSKDTFKQYAKKKFVLLEVDFPSKPLSKKLTQQNNALAKQYKIEGYPTVLLLDSKGRVLGKTGYQRGGAEKYIKHLDSLLAKRR